MRRDKVTLLIDMVRTTMAQVSSIRQVADAIEDDGDVTELIADSLDEAHTELERVEEDLREYRATEAKA